MRIAFLADRIPPYERGGGGKIPWRLGQGFLAQGHKIFIITATPEASHQETREGIHIDYLHSGYNPRWRAWRSVYNPQALTPLRQLLTHIQPDVVNVHNVHTDLSYAVCQVANQLGYPVVFSSHDLMPFAYTKVDYFIDRAQCGVVSPRQYQLPWGYNLRQARFRYNPLRNWQIRRILTQHTQERVAISHAHREALEANGLPPFQVVYHGFDPEEYPRPHDQIIETVRARLGLAGRKVIFFGGRLSVEKGSLQTLQALNQVVQTVPEATLLVLSATPFERSLLQGLEHIRTEHICEGGWLSGEELLAAYHLAEVITVPSVYLDPVPTTVFEAMAVAKPAVVTCYGGTPEVVQDGETAYVVNPFNTYQFAQRLITCLTDSDLAARMGQAAQAHLRRNFSFQQQLDGMFSAYETAIRVKGHRQ